MIGIRECADCHEVSSIYARGLCQSCYRHHQRRGTLGRFPLLGQTYRSGHPGKKVLLEEYGHMRSLLGHDGAVARLCDAYGLDERSLLASLNKYERQAAA